MYKIFFQLPPLLKHVMNGCLIGWVLLSASSCSGGDNVFRNSMKDCILLTKNEVMPIRSQRLDSLNSEIKNLNMYISTQNEAQSALAKILASEGNSGASIDSSMKDYQSNLISSQKKLLALELDLKSLEMQTSNEGILQKCLSQVETSIGKPVPANIREEMVALLISGEFDLRSK